MIYDMIYLSAIWLPPGGSSTVHIYTQTINRTIQNKQYIEQHNNFVRYFYFLFLTNHILLTGGNPIEIW